MNAKDAKALADLEQPRLAKQRAVNVNRDLDLILRRIEDAASQGAYTCIVDLTYKENVVFLEKLGYTLEPANYNMVISWQN